MKSKKILVTGTQKDLTYAQVGTQLWVHVNGETSAFPLVEKKLKRGAKSQDSESGDIIAPMPGKITRVLAQAGDKISKGQTVIVMEAMKMEYNLKALADITVKNVSGKVGELVSLGHVLVSGQIMEKTK